MCLSRELLSEDVDSELVPVRGIVLKIRKVLLELNQRNKALFLFEEQNSFRKRAKRIVKSRCVWVCVYPGVLCGWVRVYPGVCVGVCVSRCVMWVG